MLECKLAQGKKGAFVRDVKAAPEPMAVCFMDWQLQDLQRFCTNPAEFTILSAISGDSSVIPGPVLVNQEMKFASFNYFASVLIHESKKLRYVRAFGTDGDTNLSGALGHNFPFALSLLCFIHFERNLCSKLHDIGISKEVANEFIHDVMGNRAGGTYQEGLVDCTTVIRNLLDLTVFGTQEINHSVVCLHLDSTITSRLKHKTDVVRYNSFAVSVKLLALVLLLLSLQLTSMSL